MLGNPEIERMLWNACQLTEEAWIASLKIMKKQLKLGSLQDGRELIIKPPDGKHHDHEDSFVSTCR
jgi:hypothetical protein